MKFRTACLWAGLLPCLAQAQVLIPRTVPYQDATVASDDIRQTCDWNTRLSEFIVKNAAGVAVIAGQSTPQAGQRILSMSVSNLHAISGGSFTGSKWAVVHGELRDGDQLVGSFSFRRSTGHGKWTTGGTLTYIAKALGEDIGDWLQHPSLDAKHDD